MTLRIATFNLENLGAKPGHSADETVPLEQRIAILRPQLERCEKVEELLARPAPVPGPQLVLRSTAMLEGLVPLE